MNQKISAIAFYLPQFHPIPENDLWWGKGFTEWTNTAKAKPLFQGHYQPHVPADLGFYDLRCAESREAQAKLAKEYGITGFCYYHYWFGGKRILERPFNEVLSSSQPDLPFCLCWANQTWTGIWHGTPNKILVEQTYPGEADYRAHFEALLPAFSDSRYIRVQGKPLFVVYRPSELPDAKAFVRLWTEWAQAAGLPGFYFVGVNHNDKWTPQQDHFDAAILQKLPPKKPNVPWKYPLLKLRQLRHNFQLTIHRYADIYPTLTRNEQPNHVEFPCAIPNWDNTPRSGLNGLVMQDSTPALFQQHFDACLRNAKRLPEDQQIVFVKSWNEWAEGNHLEPDLRYGHAYLEVVKNALDNPGRS
ncbi:MAG: glycoside hydrolase family 99-like domain-containing protein [Pseudomonadota bacterium]